MRKPLTGQLYRDASGRNSYEIFDAEAQFIFSLADMLQDRFGFSDFTLPAFGLDQVYMECSKDNRRIILGWDNWSGCFVTTNEPENDAFVAEIGAYLDRALQELSSSEKDQQ